MNDTRILIDATYKAIEEIEKRQLELRDECEHEEILVTYSWRVGAYEDAYVCKHCDVFIQYKAQREQPDAFMKVFKGTPNK